MNKDKYVFAQLVSFLDNFKFLRIVKKYDGDKYVKSTQTKKMKVNRPKAMCFNYAMLKAEFGLNLETEVISETEELAEDAEPTDSAPVSSAVPPKPSSLFDPPDKEEDAPF